MTAYTYSRVAALNFNTTPPQVAKSATGSVYAIADTTFTTPLTITLVVGGSTATTISSDASGFFPDFTVADRTSVVWKQASSSFTTVLTTSDPVPGPTGATGAAGATGAQGPRGDLASWQASTYYPLNQVVANPSGVLMRVTTAHTSGASYDATKFAEAVADRLLDTALNSTFVPKWKATTAYLAGDKVLNPSGDVVSAKVNFTSGGTYNAANWDIAAASTISTEVSTAGHTARTALDGLYAPVNATGVNALTGRVHVSAYGAKGDAQGRNSCAMTSGSAILTTTGGNFLTTAVAGQIIAVAGAGAAGAALVTTIASVQSDNQITLAATASTTVAAANHMYGTDDSAAINAALTAAKNAKAPIQFDAKAYFGSNLIAYSSVAWLGAENGGDLFGTSTNNFGGTWLITTPGSNASLVKTFNFDALTGTNGTSAPQRFGFRDIVFDGAGLNGYNTSGTLVQIYGATYTVEGCIFQYGASNGVYTEWGSGGYEMESYWTRFHLKNNGGASLQIKGPHDSMFHMGQVSGGGSGTKGIWVDGGGAAGAQFNQVHVWGSFDWCWYVTSGSTYVNCKGEGATVGQFYLGAGDVHISATELFNGATSIGLQLGDTARFPSGCTVDVKITGVQIPIKVVTDSGYNTIKANVHLIATGSPVTGSFQDSTAVQITSDNDGATGVHEHNGQWQIPAPTTVVKTDPKAFSVNNDANAAVAYVDTSATPAKGVLTVRPGSGVTADTAQFLDNAGNLQFAVTSSGPLLPNVNSTGKIRNAAGRTNLFMADVSSGVNTPQVSNAVSGSGPVYGVNTSDTNCDIVIQPKGTGGVKLGVARMFTGSGAPTVSASSGDFYFRTDTPTTANQRLYVCTGTTNWTGIL